MNGSGTHRTGLNYRRADEITVEPVRWAWAGYMPLGQMCAICGPPGLGKTTLAIGISAQATRGDLPGDLDGPTGVLYATAEDAASVLTGRLVAAGGDRSRFLVMDSGSRLRLPDHAAEIADIAVRENVKNIIIDPWSAFTSGDTHKDSEVRQAMAPLYAAIAEQEITVTLIMHLNKGGSSDLIHRVSGSVANTAAPRSVMLWGRDPSDVDGRGPLRVLAHGKSNLGPEQPSQSYKLITKAITADNGESIEASRTLHVGSSEVSTSELLRGEQAASPERDEARAFLLDHLASGPVRSKEVLEAAKAAGVSEKTLRRARDEISNLVVKKKGSSGWYWALEEAMPEGF